MIAKAWRVTGNRGPITIRAPQIVPIGDEDKVVAYAGGGDMIPDVIFAAGRAAYSKMIDYTLKSYMDSGRIQVGRIKIGAADLISFVANQRGGAHFGTRQRKDRQERIFEILRKLESGEIEGPPLRINERHLLYHEIVSIAQAILRSPEVARLREWNS